ncbi:MAG TPA: hypothetical protein VIL74_02310 [Pyrinomonadaceae bacterium]|jgi:hypothetical protein
MDYRISKIEQLAQEKVNELGRDYLIESRTAERLNDILVCFYLSQASKNQRGVELQTEKLENVLHNCPKRKAPELAAEP